MCGCVAASLCISVSLCFPTHRLCRTCVSVCVNVCMYFQCMCICVCVNVVVCKYLCMNECMFCVCVFGCVCCVYFDVCVCASLCISVSLNFAVFAGRRVDASWCRWIVVLLADDMRVEATHSALLLLLLGCNNLIQHAELFATITTTTTVITQIYNFKS